MVNIPKSAEQDHHDHSQQSYGPMFGFLEHFDETVKESCQPKEPFEERGQHHGPHDGDIHDLCPVSANLSTHSVPKHTSCFGHGAVMGGIPLSPGMVGN